MTTPTLIYARKHQEGVNWVTAIVMAAFHLGAGGCVLLYRRGRLGLAWDITAAQIAEPASRADRQARAK